jgi:hypothetical protein
MKIFEINNKYYRLLAYNKLDLNLIERHFDWCQKPRDQHQISIYLIFFIQTPEELKQWNSNKLSNKYCLVYFLEKEIDDNWIKKFCNECYNPQFTICPY